MIPEKEFREIIERHQDTVYKIAFSQLRNKSDTDDAFQDVFIKYLEKAPVFVDGEHEKAWLIRVTINTCKSVLRSPWHKAKVYIPDAFRSESADYDELLDAVLRLPPKYSIPLHLYYYEEYSGAEIAGILGIKEATVRTRLRRAREKLKTELI